MSRVAGKHGRLAAPIIALFLLISGIRAVQSTYHPTHITVTGLGDPLRITSHKSTLERALREHGVELHPKDRISYPLNTKLRKHSALAVRIRKAFPVTVAVDGTAIRAETASQTVSELLNELAISLGPDDRTLPPLEEEVLAGGKITIKRREFRTVVDQLEIPFDTVRREDTTMAIGETREIQKGLPGVKEQTTQVLYEDGQEVSREILEERLVEPPTHRLIAYGTIGVVSRGGTDYRYVKEFMMTATGYTAGKESNPTGNGFTYTGIRARRGVVAVDPRVIPLGTRLYIEGYGVGLAADIGGAIKGNRIDLCFDTVAEALQWGIRPARVYVLTD